jgi:uncharacterized protein YajQ (UPF0234 family)
MAVFSFDISANFDMGEMNNVFDQAQRELTNRYDLKGTHTALEWLDDKKGFKIYGDTQFHLDAVIDIIRKKAATRGINLKTFDTSKEPETTNLRMIWLVPFKQTLSTEDAKKVTALLREKLPKVKAQIQGDEVRVMSPKKDELQQAMHIIKQADFAFPVAFQNLR